MVQGRMENGKLILDLSGEIDSTNAGKVEKQIREIRNEESCDSVELNCDQLKYVSSAGLRVILRMIQETHHMVINDVYSDLYEILDMTGFTEMAEVHKVYRVISVEGCEIIGQGASGKIYRIGPDSIVKVYMNPEALQEIKRSRELARLAFVAGVPTAIPYDVVRIEGGGYGSVFELLDAQNFADLIIRREKTPEEVAKMSIDLLGIPMETTQAFWRRSLELYLGTEDAEAVDEVENKVKVISMMRMIRHELRRDGLNREDGRKAIETFRAQLAELLPKVDSLTI